MNIRRTFLYLGIVPLLFLGCSGDMVEGGGMPELEPVREVGVDVFNAPGTPMLGFNSMTHRGEYLYVYDSKGKSPFYAVHTDSFDLEPFGRWGEGPRELSQRGAPVVLSATEKKLCAFSSLTDELLIFDRRGLQAEADLNVSAQIEGSSFLYAINETTGVVVPTAPAASDEEFARVHRFGLEGISEEGRPLGSYSDLPEEFKPLRSNPLLKIGPIASDRNGNVYWANYYSSLIAAFQPDGTPLYANLGLRGVQVPEAELREKEGVTMGDPEEATQSTLSLAFDGKYLYRLYSGDKISREDVKAYQRGNVENLLGHAQIVDVFWGFNEKSIKHHSFKLSVPALNLAVDEGHLYAITQKETPRLLVYEKVPALRTD